MSPIAKFEGGSASARGKLNSIVEVSNTVSSIFGGGIIEVRRTSGGSVLSLSIDALTGLLANQTDDGTVAIENTGTVTIPEFGVVFLPTMTEIDIHGAVRPTRPYLDNLAIAAEEIAAGAIGKAWVQGRCLALLEDWATLTASYFPCLAVCKRDSFYLQRHFGDGNIRVTGKSGVTDLAFVELKPW